MTVVDLSERVNVGCGGGVPHLITNQTIIQKAELSQSLAEPNREVPFLISGKEVSRRRWLRQSGLLDEVGKLVPHGRGGYVRIGSVYNLQFPFLKENGSAPPNRGVDEGTFLR